MGPLDPLGWLRIACGVGALFGAWLIVDWIGDIREASVRAEIAREVETARVAADKRISESEAAFKKQFDEDSAERDRVVGELVLRTSRQTQCDLPEDLRLKINKIKPRT